MYEIIHYNIWQSVMLALRRKVSYDSGKSLFSGKKNPGRLWRKKHMSWNLKYKWIGLYKKFSYEWIIYDHILIISPCFSGEFRQMSTQLDHAVNSYFLPIFAADTYGKIILLHSVELMYGQVTCLDQWVEMSVLDWGCKDQYLTHQILLSIYLNYCQCFRSKLLCNPGSQREGEVEENHSQPTVEI